MTLFLLPPPESRVPVPDESISVQILDMAPLGLDAVKQPTPGRRDAAPIVATGAQKAPSAQAVATTALPDGQPTIEAKQFFSAEILANPRSKQAREGLSQLAPDERIVQLCNVEAMEQVHRWSPGFAPDFLVAYAMADTKLTGRKLRADGGAFRSNGHWYVIKYTCDVAPDVGSVVGFEFRVGDEIPESEWSKHFLSAGASASH